MRLLAGSLPAKIATFFGFERQLAKRTRRTDFAFSLSPCGIVWASESRRWPALAELIATARSQAQRNVPAVWLEFDMYTRRNCSEPPNVFVACDRESARFLSTQLLEDPCRSILQSCLAVCPSDTLQLGMMLARSLAGVRLCALSLCAESVLAFLKAIAWPGDQRALEASIGSYADLCDGFGVHVDVRDAVSPKLGLELLYNGTAAQHQPDRERRWSELLMRLVSDHLCFESERGALLAWASVRQFEAPLIERLIAAAVESQEQLLHGTLRRGLQHIKLSLGGAGRVSAKAYYGAVFEPA
ncbi:MAG: hypothetical protein WBX23_17175 [Candidatus Cybelea sp.]